MRNPEGLYCDHCDEEITEQAEKWLGEYVSLLEASRILGITFNTAKKWGMSDYRVIRVGRGYLVPPTTLWEWKQRKKYMVPLVPHDNRNYVGARKLRLKRDELN